MQIDHASHFGRKLWRQLRKRTGGIARKIERSRLGARGLFTGLGILRQRRSHEQCSEAAAQGPQEMTTRLRLQCRHSQFANIFRRLLRPLSHPSAERWNSSSPSPG